MLKGKRVHSNESNSAITILLVDDEPHIIELNQMYLEQEGYRVVTARNGVEALQQFRREQPTLVVLDLMMPQMDGWTVCREVQSQSETPIIMLTARDDDVDKIVGLEMGADDYVTKPFNPRELVARIRSVLRRLQRAQDAVPRADSAPSCLHLRDLTLDPARREVTVNGAPVHLRGKEFDLLHCLLQNQELVMSRNQLLDLVWGYDFFGDTRTVDVHVASLRKAIKASAVQIETVWGVGYKLVGAGA